MPTRIPRRTALGLLALVLVLAVQGHRPDTALAALGASKTCFGPDGGSTASPGDVITCTLTITGDTATRDIPEGATIQVNTVGNNYTFEAATCTSAGTCIQSVTTSLIVATCVGNNDGDPDDPCSSITIEETLLVTALRPTTITQQITVAGQTITRTASFTIVPPGTLFFVSTSGDDENNCQSRRFACATINRALDVVRDGDTINLLAGTYTIARTVHVTKLVTIQPESGAKVVLKANPGITIFAVTAQGGPNLHVIISNFTMGGNYKEGLSDPAIRLINDGYTEIARNIIGAEDLPINNGIVLGNSLRPNIHDNTFQGNTQFVFTPLLVVGRNITGFGVVTVECLGQPGYSVSSGVNVKNNLFTNLWTAGVWLCSDGAGQHDIADNVFRNHWRGIALKDITDSRIANNTLAAGRSDGIILYGASLHNRIEGNQIESHVAVAAAGIRVGWIADPILPVDTLVENNRLQRLTNAIHVFGARTTQIRGNTIQVSGIRTAILLTPATFLGDPGTQPRDTEITGNSIVFAGPCTPVIGCALRLLGVNVPVLATDNDWGLRRRGDVEGVIWHNMDDPPTGRVTFSPFRNEVFEAGAVPGVPVGSAPSSGSFPGPTSGPTPSTGFPPLPTVTPTPSAGSSPSGPTPADFPGQFPPLPSSTVPAGPTVTATGSSGQTDYRGVRTLALDRGCTRLSWPGVTGYSVVDAAMGVFPAEAQQSVRIWRQSPTWQVWSPQRDDPSSEVFELRRNEPVIICVSQPASWLVPTEVGG